MSTPTMGDAEYSLPVFMSREPDNYDETIQLPNDRPFSMVIAIARPGIRVSYALSIPGMKGGYIKSPQYEKKPEEYQDYLSARTLPDGNIEYTITLPNELMPVGMSILEVYVEDVKGRFYLNKKPFPGSKYRP